MYYRFDGKEPVIGDGSYVSETAIIIGDVVIGKHCYIGHGAILRGDYGAIRIGNGAVIEEGGGLSPLFLSRPLPILSL